MNNTKNKFNTTISLPQNSNDKDSVYDRKHSLKNSDLAICISIFSLLLNFTVICIALFNSKISKIQSKTAIKAIQNADLRFEIENSPYLQIQKLAAEVKYNHLQTQYGENEKINIYLNWEFTNLGKHPIKITNQKFSIIIRQIDGYQVPKDLEPFWDALNKQVLSNNNIYVSNTNPISNTDLKIIDAPKKIIQFNTDDFIFYSGEVHYFNLITRNKHKYQFCAMIKSFDRISFDLIYSENS